MKYDERSLLICCICVIIGFILLLFGIITSEIEINKTKGELYGNTKVLCIYYVVG